MWSRLILVVTLIGSTLACGSSSSPPSSPTPSPSPGAAAVTATIPMGARNLTTNAFGANPLAVSRGTRVTWMNSDTIAHTATSNDRTTWDSGLIAPGGSFSRSFDTAGTFGYFCTLHPGMVGTVIVQ
jgi:plastocyanin